MTALATAVALQLEVGAGRIQRVGLVRLRSADPERLVLDERPEAAADRVAALFALCGRAHRAALLAAARAAAGVRAAPRFCGHELLAEEALAHGLTLGVTWPVLVGREPTLEPLRKLRAAVEELHQGVREAAVRAARALEDIALQPSSIRLIGRANGYGMQDVADRLNRRVAAAQAVAQQLRKSADACGHEVPAASEDADGEGEATVGTARGPLRYRLALKGGRIARLVVDTPTERLLAADGPLLGALRGRSLRAPAELTASLVLAAFDPCIPCGVEVLQVTRELAHA